MNCFTFVFIGLAINFFVNSNPVLGMFMLLFAWMISDRRPTL